MVITVLEAHLALDKVPALQAAYTKGLADLPPQITQTFLLQSTADETLWQIITVWKSRAALDEMRRSVETPAGVLMFRAAGAEPKISVYSVLASAPCWLALCDCGGSNGYRSRLWKVQLQEKLADMLGMTVMVCHYPTGASKWNPIEHRLFGPISINWAAKPLHTLEIMLACNRGTTTKTGLQVSAFLHEKVYARGIKVTGEVMESLRLTRHAACPNWN